MGIFDNFAKELSAATTPVTDTARVAESIGQIVSGATQQVTGPMLETAAKQKLTGQYALTPARLAWAKNSKNPIYTRMANTLENVPQKFEEIQNKINDLKSSLPMATDKEAIRKRIAKLSSQRDKFQKDVAKARERFNEVVPSLNELKELTMLEAQKIRGGRGGRGTEELPELVEWRIKKNYTDVDKMINSIPIEQMEKYSILPGDASTAKSALRRIRGALSDEGVYAALGTDIVSGALEQLKSVNEDTITQAFNRMQNRIMSKGISYRDPKTGKVKKTMSFNELKTKKNKNQISESEYLREINKILKGVQEASTQIGQEKILQNIGRTKGMEILINKGVLDPRTGKIINQAFLTPGAEEKIYGAMRTLAAIKLKNSVEEKKYIEANKELFNRIRDAAYFEKKEGRPFLAAPIKTIVSKFKEVPRFAKKVFDIVPEFNDNMASFVENPTRSLQKKAQKTAKTTATTAALIWNPILLPGYGAYKGVQALRK